jgi:hypothetical protein
MPSSNPRCVRRPIFEALESRTLMSSTPILLHQLISTGKPASYHESSLNGLPFTVHIRNGAVNIYKLDNRLELNATGTSDITTLTVQAPGKLQFADIVISGDLKQFQAIGMTLAGTMAVGGSVGNLSMGSVSGTLAIHDSLGIAKVGGVSGTIAVGGTITKLTSGSLNNALILSGAVLPADNPNGIQNNTYAPGAIGRLVIMGPMINSNIAVGTSPGPDDVFGNSDDTSAGGGGIGKITLSQGADPESHIEAGAFDIVRTKPYATTQPVKRLQNPLTDPHFVEPSQAPVT